MHTSASWCTHTQDEHTIYLSRSTRTAIIPGHIQRLQNAHANEKYLNYHIDNAHFSFRILQRNLQALVCRTSSKSVLLGHATPHCYVTNTPQSALETADNRRGEQRVKIMKETLQNYQFTALLPCIIPLRKQKKAHSAR